MDRKRDGLVPIGEVLGTMGGAVKEIREASPQALHHFTQADQVEQLVKASEADPDRGFMARLMALCSLPRTNPGNRKEYVRRNGPYFVVRTDDGLVVKRADKRDDGRWQLVSDHPRCPEVPWPEDAVIIGEVRWMASEL